MDTGNFRLMVQDIVKLDSFDGTNYTRWAKKVKFLLLLMNVFHVMDENLEPIPENPKPEAGKTIDPKVIADLEKQRLLRKEQENLACGHIKNVLSDHLYDLYAPITCPRELWKALENKYKAHEEGTNKYLVSRYLRFQMVDDNELQVLVNKMNHLNIPLPEIFQVGAVVDKLPPSWKDFSKRMMHKSEDYSLDDLLKHLRIEEETRNRDKKGKAQANVHSVQAGGKGKRKVKSAGPTKKWNLGPQKKSFKKHGQPMGLGSSKRNGKCHVCGETGHYARECKQRKSGTPGVANAVTEIGDLVANLSMEEIDMLAVPGTLLMAARGGWFLDTGATVHVCDSRAKFVEYHELHDGRQVTVANRNRADVAGIGTVQLHFTSGNILTLLNVLHVPTIAKSLVSYNRLDLNGFGIRGGNGVIVFLREERYVGRAYNDRGMYRLSLKDRPDDDTDSDESMNGGSDDDEDSDDESIGSNAMMVEEIASDGSGVRNDLVSDSFVFPLDEFVMDGDVIVGNINEIYFDYSVCSISLWHKRLAHTNIKNIEKMQNKGLIKINNKDFDKCETCVKSKFTKKPFPSVKRNTSILELIHSDICELNGILTRGGKRYFITFCDDFNRFLYVYLLHSKDEAFKAFKLYKAEVENQKEKRIKILRSDRGGEYFSNEFDTFCEENGIKHERTSPFTPQQNGLAERKNRTLVEMVNCMLNQSNRPTDLWGEALLTACYIHNRITSRVIPTSPYELWEGRKPNLDHFKVWGCVAYYRTPDPKRSKLGARAIKSIFVGYAHNSPAYRLLDNDSGVIVESRDVDFFEDKFSEDAENSDRTLDTNLPGTSRENSKAPQRADEPHRSTRVRKEKSLGDDFQFYLVEGSRKKVTREVILSFNVNNEPKTFKEAMSSRDASLWKEAINDEMDSIMGNGSWILADLPKGAKPIGSKWIFKIKRNPDGSISAFKARLVAKGFRQREGVDYFDTYAPVARIGSIRTLIAISTLKGLYIHQMDVKTAFLNGLLKEEIYMEQPEGFVVPGQENKVCRLVKSLYGLKQAHKQWHERFDATVTSFGFKHNGADRCIYSKYTKEFTVVICLHVDDMLIIGTNLAGILETEDYLSSNFSWNPGVSAIENSQHSELRRIPLRTGVISVQFHSSSFFRFHRRYESFLIQILINNLKGIKIDTGNFRLMVQDIVKLDSFDGTNYTRWAEKVKFLLLLMNVFHVMDENLEPIPENPKPEAGKTIDPKVIADLEKQRLLRKEQETLACGHIKNVLYDRLYDLYAPITCPCELWKALENKYKAQEEGTNKYLVSRYLRFQMVDDKPILEQVHELQVLVNKMNHLNIPLPEILQVGAVVDKLPPSWKDFSKRMMHKSEDYSLDDLLKHLRIEEETRNRDKKGKAQGNVHSVQARGMGKGKVKSAGPTKKWKLGPQKKSFKKHGQPMGLGSSKRNGKCHVSYNWTISYLYMLKILLASRK
ncbi:hypothetical protein OSB04_006182 [Centaurea solstitialis]|uniref:Uncharacterized protein n=1 Tax=Centaurea solstitialis TaxID=347529 RepID=A0AA38WH71_9ASTR|nr:hypothetical protein OSB04_006182 [Centaurea solstitialis]